MRGYSVSGPSESGTGPKTAVTVIASASVRPRLYDLVLGNIQAPADQAFHVGVGRTTTTGTAASNPTPNKLDPGDVAAVATAGITHSAEPTYDATNLLEIPLNFRASFRWVANPGYELVVPATASNCLGVRNILSTAAGILRATAHWFE